MVVRRQQLSFIPNRQTKIIRLALEKAGESVLTQKLPESSREMIVVLRDPYGQLREHRNELVGRHFVELIIKFLP